MKWNLEIGSTADTRILHWRDFSGDPWFLPLTGLELGDVVEFLYTNSGTLAHMDDNYMSASGQRIMSFNVESVMNANQYRHRRGSRRMVSMLYLSSVWASSKKDGYSITLVDTKEVYIEPVTFEGFVYTPMV